MNMAVFHQEFCTSAQPGLMHLRMWPLASMALSGLGSAPMQRSLGSLIVFPFCCNHPTKQRVGKILVSMFFAMDIAHAAMAYMHCHEGIALTTGTEQMALPILCRCK